MECPCQKTVRARNFIRWCSAILYCWGINFSYFGRIFLEVLSRLDLEQIHNFLFMTYSEPIYGKNKMELFLIFRTLCNICCITLVASKWVHIPLKFVSVNKNGFPLRFIISSYHVHYHTLFISLDDRCLEMMSVALIVVTCSLPQSLKDKIHVVCHFFRNNLHTVFHKINRSSMK